MDTLCLGFLYFGDSLKEALAAFLNLFGVCSIRVYSNFSLDPYYEPLPWFMIDGHMPFGFVYMHELCSGGL